MSLRPLGISSFSTTQVRPPPRYVPPNNVNHPFFYDDVGMYTRGEDSPVLRVDAPRATRRDFVNYFSKWENGKVLFGTAWSWFALDIAFCGLGLNSSVILGAIGFGAPSNAAAAKMGEARAVWVTLRNISVGNLVISIAGLIPGFYVTMAFIDVVRTLRSCYRFCAVLDGPACHTLCPHTVGSKTNPVYGIRYLDHHILQHGLWIR